MQALHDKLVWEWEWLQTRMLSQQQSVGFPIVNSVCRGGRIYEVAFWFITGNAYKARAREWRAGT